MNRTAMAILIARTLFTKSPISISSSILLSQSKSILLTIVGDRDNLLSPTSPASGLMRWFSTSMKAPGQLMPPDPKTVLLPNIPRRGRTVSSYTHWQVMMELPKPEEEMNRDQVIEYYIKTLAKVLGGSEEEAKKKMFSVSTRHHYFFVCNVSSEISDRMWELPGVIGICPLSEANVKRTDFAHTGEPFVNGEAVPYDPKYHVGVLAVLNGPSQPRKRHNYKETDKNLAAMENRNRRARREEENRRNLECATRWETSHMLATQRFLKENNN